MEIIYRGNIDSLISIIGRIGETPRNIVPGSDNLIERMEFRYKRLAYWYRNLIEFTMRYLSHLEAYHLALRKLNVVVLEPGERKRKMRITLRKHNKSVRKYKGLLGSVDNYLRNKLKESDGLRPPRKYWQLNRK